MTTSTDSIHWSDTYLLGYGPMDETHREFVQLVRALQTSSDAELLPAMTRLQAHCVAHFGQEKRWMDDTGIPGRDCHDNEHEAVLNSVNAVLALLRSALDSRSVAITHSLAIELVRWFPGHADHMDSALSHWMSMQRFGGKPVVIRRGALGGAPPAEGIQTPGAPDGAIESHAHASADPLPL